MHSHTCKRTHTCAYTHANTRVLSCGRPAASGVPFPHQCDPNTAAPAPGATAQLMGLSRTWEVRGRASGGGGGGGQETREGNKQKRGRRSRDNAGRGWEHRRGGDEGEVEGKV